MTQQLLWYSLNPEHAVKSLNEQMPPIEQWCRNNKIAINTDKSQLMIIRRKKRHKKINSDVILFNNKIPITNKATYLGITFNDKFTWNLGIQNIINKTYAAYNCLKPLLNANSSLPIDLKRLLYLQCLRPILTYACPAWGNIINKTQTNKLEIVQNKILRRITGAPRYLPNTNIKKDLNIDPIMNFINKLNASFYSKSKNNDPGGFNTLLNKELIVDMKTHNPITAFMLSDCILSKHYK